MVYNLTAIGANSTNIMQFFVNVDGVLMGNTLGILLLIGISAVILLAFMFNTNDTSKSVIATTFIAFILAIFLTGIGLLPNYILVIILILCAISVAFGMPKD